MRRHNRTIVRCPPGWRKSASRRSAPAGLVSSASPDVLARLDAIILEAVLLKQEIQKIR